MKNKIRFENLTHFIFLFLLFLSFTTIFLSMNLTAEEAVNNEIAEDKTTVCGVVGIEFTAEISEGRNLFRANCGSCHASDMASDLTGPALGGVTERWARREADLNGWIRNSSLYLSENSSDKYAIALSKKYPATMTVFPNLNDEEIENILTYIETVYNQ